MTGGGAYEAAVPRQVRIGPVVHLLTRARILRAACLVLVLDLELSKIEFARPRRGSCIGLNRYLSNLFLVVVLRLFVQDRL
jgi:hypothetical protein